MRIEPVVVALYPPAMGNEQCDRVRRLIEHATLDGCLSRAEDEAIVAAMVASLPVAADTCGLYRALQERVWQAELTLES